MNTSNPLASYPPASYWILHCLNANRSKKARGILLYWYPSPQPGTKKGRDRGKWRIINTEGWLACQRHDQIRITKQLIPTALQRTNRQQSKSCGRTGAEASVELQEAIISGSLSQSGGRVDELMGRSGPI